MSLRTACPKCLKPLVAPNEAIGKQARCPACQHTWRIAKPSENTPKKQIPAPAKTEADGSLRSSSNVFDEMMADSYPRSASEASADVAPRAAPAGPKSAGLWRDGSRLVVSSEGWHFPRVCVKTGQSTAIRTTRLKMVWLPPSLILAVMFGFIGYLISFARRQTLVLDVPVDAHWFRQYSIRRLLGRLTMIAGCLCAIYGLAANRQVFVTPLAVPETQQQSLAFWLTSGVSIGIVGGAFLAIACRPILSLRKMRDGYAWLAGANCEFLDQLPEWER